MRKIKRWITKAKRIFFPDKIGDDIIGQSIVYAETKEDTIECYRNKILREAYYREEVEKASTRPKYVGLLWEIAKNNDTTNAVELGTAFGVGTLTLSKTCRKVTTIEKSIERYTFTKDKFRFIDNVEFVRGEIIDNFKLFDYADLIFIDAHHEGPALLSYFNEAKKRCYQEAIIIIDDINYSKDMQTAWRIIKRMKGIDLIYDTYYWGIVKLGPGPAKKYKLYY